MFFCNALFKKIFVPGFLLLSSLCFAEEKILFLHIPKSGGLTFNAILKDHYSLGESSQILWNQLDHQVNKFKDRKMISGHLLYSRIKDYCAGFKKVTFLRDPVARILSEQRYLLNFENPDKVLRQHFLPPERNPIDSAENVACLFLSRLDPFDLSIPIEKHLESAKETLARDFDFVGITEQMDESVTLFCNLLGWKVPEEIPVYNTTDSSSSNYPQSVLDAIAKRNWADIELYRFAKELFALEKLRILPFVREEIVQWTDQINYDFNGPLDGYGWCPRERWREGTFRWLCSTERGCIDFPLIAGYNYSFEGEFCMHPSLLCNLSISVNGIPVPYHIYDLDHSERHGEYRWFVCSATIHHALIENGKKTRLELAIHDPGRIPPRDFYRGRCGSKRISIRRS